MGDTTQRSLKSLTIVYQGDEHDGQGGQHDDQHGGQQLVVEPVKPKLQRPPRYKVLLNNDDYTPMEFVVDVLKRFFAMNEEKATEIMLAVHNSGRAVCGLYTADIAETKVAQVTAYARKHDHPLLCTMEKE